MSTMSLSSRFFSSKLTGHAQLGGTNADLVFGRFCNGGSLEELMNKYRTRLIAIPEHFIW